MPTAGFWHWPPAITVTICWGLFELVWLAGAIYNSRRAPAVRERSTSVSPWLIEPVLVLGWIAPARIWRPITVDARWLMLLGVAVPVVSTVFILWARSALGTMWTSSAVVKDGHMLRTDGPYGITRHPIYTGMLGMLAGTSPDRGAGPVGGRLRHGRADSRVEDPGRGTATGPHPRRRLCTVPPAGTATRPWTAPSQ